MRKQLVIWGALIISAVATSCQMPTAPVAKGQMSYFIGVDISGSFRTRPEFKDSLDFLAQYVYAHVHGFGDLKKPKALFVGAIGGNYEDDPQVFHSAFDFENKTPDVIRIDLERWFAVKDRLTDFNSFFVSIASMAKKRNLTLSPITIILITDGIPEGTEVETGKAARKAYTKINVGPVEYLARNVTLRLLYPSAKAAKDWEDFVPHRRLRFWAVPAPVMQGWRAQWSAAVGPDAQTKLYEWIQYNIDFRVRTKAF